MNENYFVYQKALIRTFSHLLFDYATTFMNSQFTKNFLHTQLKFLTLNDYWLHLTNQIWVKNIYYIHYSFVFFSRTVGAWNQRKSWEVKGWKESESRWILFHSQTLMANQSFTHGYYVELVKLNLRSFSLLSLVRVRKSGN